MDLNLSSYFKVYNNWLDDKLCETTVKQLDGINWKQHQFYNSTTKESIAKSGNQELDVSWDNIDTKDIIMDRIWHAYSKYLQELNFPWFNGWAGFTAVRFNKYTENRKMAEHCDHIHSMFDGQRKGIPTLTALGILNDDYTGGEFVIWETETIKLKKGDMVIFPSCFLYPHRVEPLLSGVRYSCVSWAW